MTADQHARLIIGDLVFTLARVSAENDALKAQLPPAPVPATAPPPSADASDPHVASTGNSSTRDASPSDDDDHVLPTNWKAP